MSLKAVLAVLMALEVVHFVIGGTYDSKLDLSLAGVTKPIPRFNWTLLPSTKLDPMKRLHALQQKFTTTSSSDDEPSTRIDLMKPESKIGKKPYDFFVFPVFLPLLLLALGFLTLPFRLFASPLKFLLGRRRRSIDAGLMETSALARKCEAVDGKLPDYCLETMK